ncbi:GerAB/ArcD/ProY family transporter [Metabacillus herbersteinensis]|uniref:GerAB/ArcD/ProY family transporter n=1 Tax=Metabacillus herbersteinensis TaxID=283816 RepID=A0ABV6GAA6_9BACI
MIKIPERFQVSPFLVFYLIHSLQFGVGVLGFQRVVAEKSGHDAWIAVILAGVLVHAALWMIYRILKGANGNVITVHKEIFGKWLGGLLSMVLTSYFLLLAITVLRSYLEIVQVWMFPDINQMLFTFLFLLLVYYIISGGFRVVTGVSFFGVILPSYLIFAFFFPLEFADYRSILPVFDHSIKDIVISTKDMSLTILGVEALLIYYPFLKNVEKSQKWAHFGVAFTTVLYTFICLVSLVYFSEEQLQKNVWATLTLWKIVEMPFVERFEYIGIANWNLVILPNICLTLWCASRIIKDVTKIKQKYTVIFVCLLAFISVNFFQTREQVNMLNDIAGKIGFGVLYIYIPALFALTFVFRKIKEKKK